MVWLAPEILDWKLYDELVDTYAFGVVLWEIISRKDFFGEVKFMLEIRDAIVSGKRPEIPQCPPELKMVIELCWVCRKLFLTNQFMELTVL